MELLTKIWIYCMVVSISYDLGKYIILHKEIFKDVNNKIRVLMLVIPIDILLSVFIAPFSALGCIGGLVGLIFNYEETMERWNENMIRLDRY